MSGINIRPLAPGVFPELVEIWSAAVRATHDFLSPEDFKYFHERIASDYLPLVDLFGAYFADPADFQGCLGFLGVTRDSGEHALHVEMLFVDPAWHRRGIGRALLDFAKKMSPLVYLDVNEQNHGALNFYQSQGFEVIGRSPLDPGGKPYPLLHLNYKVE